MALKEASKQSISTVTRVFEYLVPDKAMELLHIDGCAVPLPEDEFCQVVAFMATPASQRKHFVYYGEARGAEVSTLKPHLGAKLVTLLHQPMDSQQRRKVRTDAGKLVANFLNRFRLEKEDFFWDVLFPAINGELAKIVAEYNSSTHGGHVLDFAKHISYLNLQRANRRALVSGIVVIATDHAVGGGGGDGVADPVGASGTPEAEEAEFFADLRNADVDDDDDTTDDDDVDDKDQEFFKGLYEYISGGDRDADADQGAL